MAECGEGWGLDLYKAVRIIIKKPCKGYYLRWYYNGWHYWFCLPGRTIIQTEGEEYRTIGTRKITMSSGQVTRGQAQAIRTIMNTREVYLLTADGWKNIRIEPGSIVVYDNQLAGAEINFTAIIGSKEISYDNGFSPVEEIPVVPAPDPGLCEVNIGTQIWMCKNYDADFPGSKSYEDNDAYRLIYGRLYTWSQINTPGFCPVGWHIPTLAEWNTLINYLGTIFNDGGYLKETGIMHWLTPNTGADNSSGFTALGSGFFITSYLGLLEVANFWVADEYSIDRGYLMQIRYDSAGIVAVDLPKNYYIAVRLIKDVAAPVVPPVVYDDWFLPSKDELQKVYDELYLFGIGAFGAASHWSSSEDGALKAWRLDFPSGTYFSTSKGNGYNITAVRTFISAHVYALRDFGQAGYIFHIVDNGDGTYTYYEGGLAFGFAANRFSNISLLAGTNTTIGSGNANTNLIIGQAGHIDSAALLCYNYST